MNDSTRLCDVAWLHDYRSLRVALYSQSTIKHWTETVATGTFSVTLADRGHCPRQTCKPLQSWSKAFGGRGWCAVNV